MAATRTRASAMMLKSMMDSAKMKHLARSHLFLSPQAGLKRNSFWRETMESDVLVYDFQDGCPPGERGNVVSIESVVCIRCSNLAFETRNRVVSSLFPVLVYFDLLGTT